MRICRTGFLLSSSCLIRKSQSTFLLEKQTRRSRTDSEFRWTALTKMNNDVYRYEKLERGDVWLRSESDLVHHDAHPKWSVIRHQKGGFWRCRSGLDATSVEQNCKKCFPDLNPHAPLPIQGEAMEHIAELKRRYERVSRLCLRAISYPLFPPMHDHKESHYRAPSADSSSSSWRHIKTSKANSTNKSP